MTTINPANERVKRRYLHYLAEAEGLCEKTIDNAARTIAEFEQFTHARDFRQFTSKDATGFRKKLLEKGGRRKAELSSRATVHTKLLAMTKFFRWLAGQSGFRKISYSDVAHFSLSRRDASIATARREQPTPSLEQVQRVIRAMPAETDVQKRDRALIACMLMTGIRVGAIISLRLKHVRPDWLGIDQDAKEVSTKGSKTFTSYYFQVGDDIRQIFVDYVDHLRNELLMAEHDPLFPSTKQAGGAFRVEGLSRAFWKTPGAVWDLFKRAFAAAGVAPYTPHSLRRTLVQAVMRASQSPEVIKALSQNIGHEGVLVTLTSYGAVRSQRQAELITSLDLTAPKRSDADAIADLSRALAPAVAKLLLERKDSMAE